MKYLLNNKLILKIVNKYQFAGSTYFRLNQELKANLVSMYLYYYVQFIMCEILPQIN